MKVYYKTHKKTNKNIKKTKTNKKIKKSYWNIECALFFCPFDMLYEGLY